MRDLFRWKLAPIHIVKEPLKLNSKCIVFIAMLYITCSVAAASVAYFFTGFSPIVISGASILFPITYLLSDIVTEVYGYSTARKLIWLGLVCEVIFTVLITFVIQLPFSDLVSNHPDYNGVYNHIIRFVLSSIVGDVVSSFANIYLMSKSKILLKGKKFVVRSIASTLIGELILNIIICSMAFYDVSNFGTTLKITFSGYLLELAYAVIFSYPALFLIILLKRIERRDAYDIDVNYNIFNLT